MILNSFNFHFYNFNFLNAKFLKLKFLNFYQYRVRLVFSSDPCYVYRAYGRYRQNACVNGTAYGCNPSKMSKGKAYCWSSCTTKLGNVGYQWLREKTDGYIIKSRYLECDQTKPADDRQCVNKADGSDSWICYADWDNMLKPFGIFGILAAGK